MSEEHASTGECTVINASHGNTPVIQKAISFQSDQRRTTSTSTVFAVGMSKLSLRVESVRLTTLAVLAGLAARRDTGRRLPRRSRGRRDGCVRRQICAVVLLHAQVVRVAVMDRQFLTGHPLRPLEAVLLHEWRTAVSGPDADAPAGRQWLVVVFDTNRCVHRAQEELEVRRASDLHQRPELVHLQAGLFLGVVVQLVGHRRHVVADAATHGDGDLLATRVGRRRRARAAVR